MALVSCGECGRQVSDRAAACPGCGNPIAAGGERLPPLAGGAPPSAQQVYTRDSRPVTIQATGKGPKVIQLGGAVLMVVSVFGCVQGPTASFNVFHGVGLFLVGLVLWLVGRIAAWWGHG